MKALHRKLLREFAQLRGQALAIAMVMVGGIGMMVMALSNYNALSDTRALFYRMVAIIGVVAIKFIRKGL